MPNCVVCGLAKSIGPPQVGIIYDNPELVIADSAIANDQIMVAYRVVSPLMRQAMQLMLEGHSSADAAAVVGISPNQLSKSFAQIGRQVAGHREPVRPDPRIGRVKYAQQLELFA